MRSSQSAIVFFFTRTIQSRIVSVRPLIIHAFQLRVYDACINVFATLPTHTRTYIAFKLDFTIYMYLLVILSKFVESRFYFPKKCRVG